MCKRIKDILWPLNVLGKKKKSVSIYLGEDVPNIIPINIVWTGERLIECYTLVKREYYPYPRTITTPRKSTYEAGEETEITQTIRRNGQSLSKHRIYFNCTNVTKLIVNGEQII